MNDKWTPGPWAANETCHPRTAENTWAVSDSDGRELALVDSYAGIDEPNEWNAKLMAAAPELYTALQNLAFFAAWISPPPYGHKCQWCEACSRRVKAEARHALKKARGEE